MLDIREPWDSQLPSYNWLSWASLPRNRAWVPQSFDAPVCDSSMVSQSLASYLGPQAHRLVAVTGWQTGLLITPLSFCCPHKLSEGTAPNTVRALPKSISSSTTSVNLEEAEINWEYT